MANKLALIWGQSGCRYPRLLTNGFSNFTNTKHNNAINWARERTRLYRSGGEMPSTPWAALSFPLTWPSPSLRTSKRKWDRQLEEQEGDVRANAWYLTAKSSSVLCAQVDGCRSLQSWTPCSATWHGRAPGCPQQDEVVRWASCSAAAPPGPPSAAGTHSDNPVQEKLNKAD